MKWTRTAVHEALAALYLRLNGYFTTGLVLPSPEWGESRTEVDCFAVRHPEHSQPERGVESSKFLAIGKGEVDVIICEVKSRPEDLIFNEPLRTDLEAVRALLRWAGVFSENEVISVADRLQPLLHGGLAIETVRSGVLEGRCRVRPLLCCPPCSQGDCADRWWRDIPLCQRVLQSIGEARSLLNSVQLSAVGLCLGATGSVLQECSNGNQRHFGRAVCQTWGVQPGR